jgi:rubrerythrin
MNNERRKQIADCIEKISAVRDELDILREDEEAYLFNMPDNLLDSKEARTANNAINSLECAIYGLEEAEGETRNIRDSEEVQEGDGMVFYCKHCESKFILTKKFWQSCKFMFPSKDKDREDICPLCKSPLIGLWRRCTAQAELAVFEASI